MFSVLADDLDEKNYTDVEIEFVDNNTSMSIMAHRVVLAKSSTFFDKMFRFNKFDFYRVIVPNISCAVDIIKSFYGRPYNKNDWLSTLEYLECENFFGLSINVEKLYDLIVPAKYFDLLLEKVEILFYQWEIAVKDRELVRTIKKNLPLTYDRQLLPPILVTELNKMSCRVIALSLFTFNITDTYTGKCDIIKNLPSNIIAISQNGQFIFTFIQHRECKIINLNNLEETIFEPNQLYDSVFAYDNNYLFVLRYQVLRCFDIPANKCIWTLPQCGRTLLRQSLYIPSRKYFLYIVDEKFVRILNAITGSIVCELKTLSDFDSHINKIGASADGKLLYVDRNIESERASGVHIWSLETLQLVQEFTFELTIRTCYGFTPDCESIITNELKSITFWNILSRKIIRTINIEVEKIININFSSDNKLMLIRSKNGCYVLDTNTEVCLCEYPFNPQELIVSFGEK